MKLIIAGSRHIEDYDVMVAAIEWFDEILSDSFISKPSNYVSSVVCGGSRGVDQLGKQWAEDKGLKVHMFNAEWDRHGKSAGPIRNKRMAEFGDRLLAIWDYKSCGTQSMILEAAKSNIPIHVIKCTR